MVLDNVSKCIEKMSIHSVYNMEKDSGRMITATVLTFASLIFAPPRPNAQHNRHLIFVVHVVVIIVIVVFVVRVILVIVVTINMFRRIYFYFYDRFFYDCCYVH